MSDGGPPSETRAKHAPAAAADPNLADRVFVADHLRGRDVACLRCLYNLRDVASGRCPECGAALTRRLLIWSDLPWRATIGLVGVCFSTLILVALCALTALLMFSGMLIVFGLLALLLMLTCISALATIRWERWYRHIRIHHTRWEYAFLLGAWIIPAAGMAGFVMVLALAAKL